MPITLNGSGTITGISAGGLPDAIITQPELAANVVGNGPAFSAYQSTTQAFSGATFTKVAYQTEEFDTASAFDSTTNYRFTPLVAGYYYITGSCSFGGASNTKQVAIYKNGSNYKQGADVTATAATATCLVFLNGSTDYVEVYAFSSGSANADALSNRTYFQATMVRSS